MTNLKFRVWDKKLKLLGTVSYIDFKSKKMIYHNYNGLFNYYVNFEDVEIMQSTGLFDKYGVEIFEGDIIDVGTRIPFLNKIQRDEETAYLKLVPLDKRWTESYFTNFEDKSRYEVIGNIYENKELLENEN